MLTAPTPSFEPVELARAYLLLNHGPVTLVSSAHGGTENVMAAAWTMPLDFDPPKIVVVIDRQTLTRTLIEESGEFALNIPPRAMAAQVLAVGTRSGKDAGGDDKFALTGLTTRPGTRVAAPLIEGCLAWLECRVLPETHNQQRYDLFIGEVLAAWADPRAFSDNRWHFPDAATRTMHYVAGGSFFATGEEFSVA